MGIHEVSLGSTLTKSVNEFLLTIKLASILSIVLFTRSMIVFQVN